MCFHGRDSPKKAIPSELQLREKEWLDKNVSLSQYHNLLMLTRKPD